MIADELLAIWFTPDLGHPKLKEHLAAVIALMKASSNRSGILIVVLVFGNLACGKQSDEGSQPHDDPDEGLTTLHYTARSGLVELAERAIELGADVNAKDPRGRTPLHYAANEPYYYANSERNLEMVEFLLKAGADVNAKDNEGATPLHYAAINDATKLVEVLLKAGANANEKTHSGITPLEVAIHANSSATVEVLIGGD